MQGVKEMENQIERATMLIVGLDDHLETWVEGFLIEKRAAGLSPNTLRFYRRNLSDFHLFCEGRQITRIGQITPDEVRRYLLELESMNHNAGGRHGHYRALRTFLYFYENEAEPENWKNPIHKVKAPRLPVEPIQPITLPEFNRLLKAASGTRTPERDAAILLALLDTGARAAEFIGMNLEDMEPITGAILIRKGKGSKPRTVFIGKKTRRAVRAYLRTRTDESAALWVTCTGTRLTQSGLRQVLRRLAERAGIPEHGAHDFRRAFALNMLRNGIDLITLSRLMGHSSIQVLQRYLAQTTADTEAAAARFGVVDKL
jgi:integrase/recombinase XerD